MTRKEGYFKKLPATKCPIKSLNYTIYFTGWSRCWKAQEAKDCHCKLYVSPQSPIPSSLRKLSNSIRSKAKLSGLICDRSHQALLSLGERTIPKQSRNNRALTWSAARSAEAATLSIRGYRISNISSPKRHIRVKSDRNPDRQNSEVELWWLGFWWKKKRQKKDSW